eukprot:TRINITY_DN12860_c0_g1_i1.p1 TRINITY_DN12860_c0_g1~~TRINITY_DN12860_c0_g1_i1.p1  ORF type:complete len:129 (+),score=9.24 TRINITY_DN12860_c0_g1_i1:57-389(+)
MARTSISSRKSSRFPSSRGSQSLQHKLSITPGSGSDAMGFGAGVAVGSEGKKKAKSGHRPTESIRNAAAHGVSNFRGHHGGCRAEVIEGPGVYYIGIIDILQEYNLYKKT